MHIHRAPRILEHSRILTAQGKRQADCLEGRTWGRGWHLLWGHSCWINHQLVKSPVNAHCRSAVGAAPWGKNMEQGQNLASEAQSSFKEANTQDSLSYQLFTCKSEGTVVEEQRRGKLFQPEGFLNPRYKHLTIPQFLEVRSIGLFTTQVGKELCVIWTKVCFY